MKKTLSFFALVAVIGFSSCQKDYTCHCETRINGVTQPNTGKDYELGKKSKSDADSECQSHAANTSSGVNSAGRYCDLN